MRMRVDLELTLTENTSIVINEATSTDQNNVSNLVRVETNEHDASFRGFKGFQLATHMQDPESILNGAYALYPDEGYVGFMSLARSMPSGKFATAVILSFTFSFVDSLPQLCIVFDRACNQYATEFVLKNVTTDKEFEIKNNQHAVAILQPSSDFWQDEKTAELQLKIVRWSRPYANAKITAITTSYSHSYTGKDLIDIVSSDNMLDAQLTPSPGICEQYADIKVYDRDSALRSIRDVDTGIVRIYNIDDTNGTEELVATFTNISIEANETDAEVSITCADPSSTYENIDVPAIPIKTRTIHEMFVMAFNYAGNVAWRYYNNYARNIAEGSHVPNSWFYAGKLKEMLQKICTAAGMRIFWHVDAFVLFAVNNLPYDAFASTTWLQPNVYKRTAKLSLPKECRVDSVQMQLCSNKLTDAGAVLHTETVKQVTVQGGSLSLPVASSTPHTHWRCVYNMVNDYEYAKSRISCVMAQGTLTVKLDKLSLGLPTVRITPTGVSSVVARGQNTYDNYPELALLAKSDYTLTTWVEQNRTEQKNSLSWLYDQDQFSLNPWVYRFIPTGSSEPNSTDVATTWSRYESGTASKLYWSEINSMNWAIEKQYMYVPGETDTLKQVTSLHMRDIRLPVQSKVTKLTDTIFKIDWQAPVRVEYAAASQMYQNVFQGYEDLDNWAFVDYVTGFTVELLGQTYDDATVNEVYKSKDNDSAETKYPLALDKSEVLTVDAYRDNPVIGDLAKDMADMWLQFYDRPVQTFECSVSADWAASNNLQCGCNCKIILPNRQKVSALDQSQDFFADGAVNFVLANIVRRFNQQEYVYELKLIERYTR